MKVVTEYSLQHDTAAAVAEIAASLLQRMPAAPHLLLCYFTSRHDPSVLRAALATHFPGTPLQASTSCNGVLTGAGYHSDDGFALAVWALHDPDGAYGTALVSWQPEQLAVSVPAVLYQAQLRAQRPGELPALVWVHTTRGAEERIIELLENELGASVPIVGGSAGYNLADGQAFLLDQQQIVTHGLGITLFYPSCEVATSFYSGYMPTSHRAVVTACTGREILELDYQLAADCFQHWLPAKAGVLPREEKVLLRTSLYPLGRLSGGQSGQATYKLSHVERLTARGGVVLYTDIHAGDVVTLMQGHPDVLKTRITDSVRQTLQHEYASVQSLAMLTIFCAGSLHSLYPQPEALMPLMYDSLQGVPCIAPLTFGEMGRNMAGENMHGNLMVAHVVFYRRLEGQG